MTNMLRATQSGNDPDSILLLPSQRRDKKRFRYHVSHSKRAQNRFCLLWHHGVSRKDIDTESAQHPNNAEIIKSGCPVSDFTSPPSFSLNPVIFHQISPINMRYVIVDSQKIQWYDLMHKFDRLSPAASVVRKRKNLLAPNSNMHFPMSINLFKLHYLIAIVNFFFTRNEYSSHYSSTLNFSWVFDFI